MELKHNHTRAKMSEISAQPELAQHVLHGASRNTCALSGRLTPQKSLVLLGDLRPSLAERILKDYPEVLLTALISKLEVDRYRALYVEEMLLAEHGELSELDKQVAQSLANHDTIAENVDESYDEKRPLGDRLADHLAHFGGSWIFLIGFAVMLAVWMLGNSELAGHWAIDPYPFIFLNLILSCVAAVQAPVILMSQRRTEQKDRMRSESDYRVNLKAELEIRHVHEKLDHLISKQWQRLVEIQQLQLEAMQQYLHSDRPAASV
jgi:uncharacterized membrane protein